MFTCLYSVEKKVKPNTLPSGTGPPYFAFIAMGKLVLKYAGSSGTLSQNSNAIGNDIKVFKTFYLFLGSLAATVQQLRA